MNAKIAKASRMARRKPKKAEGGPLTETAPEAEPTPAPAESPGFWQQAADKIHQARMAFVPDPSLGEAINTAMMLGPVGALKLGRGMQHPVVTADMARQAKLPTPSIEESGVGAYRNWLGGRRPDPEKPMGDIQAQGVLDYRERTGNPSDAGVWGKSAWFRGADGQARKEVVDLHSGLERSPNGPGDQFRWEHPAGDFHAAYKMPEITVSNRPGAAGQNAAGSYDPLTGKVVIAQNPNTQKGIAKASGIAPHEVTHRVQDREGFAVGSNPMIEPLFDNYWKTAGYAPPASMRVRNEAAIANNMKNGVLGFDKTSPEVTTYNRSSGEVEARNVQRRREKSYLYQKHPAETEDVPRGQQIIRRQSDITNQIGRVNDELGFKAKPQPPPYRPIGGREFADGGMPATPWFVRNEARNINTTGGLHSPVAGRTDHLPISVPSGSYVLPADVVSGLGQGNTTSGMKVLGSMFSGGPFGSGAKAPKMGGGKSIPKPPKPMKLAEGGGIAGLADEDDGSEGGGFDPSMDQMAPDDPSMDQDQDQDGVDIMAAGGEYVIDPDIVAQLGNGDIDLGHEILDEFVKSIRKDTVKELKTLPGPVKD